MTVKRELIKDRLDRLEGKGEDIGESEQPGIGISKKKDIGISNKTAKEPERFKQIRRVIEEGKTTNFYINKNGEIMQRTLIHLSLAQLEGLKREAFDSIPRITLSELIRKKLK